MIDANSEGASYAQIGKRIRRLREIKGLSRNDLANDLGVDVSSTVNWESGKHLPRDRMRAKLARRLGCEIDVLFTTEVEERAAPLAAALIDTISDLPDLLMELTSRVRRRMRALRLAAPYVTPAYVQTNWRHAVCDRLLNDTLEVDRVEIFYSLRRLQETLSNIFRYDGHTYYVKSYCVGIEEVSPSLGGYFFDDDEFLLGGYWTGIPPTSRPGIRISGQPFRTFFNEYWDEIWRRGTWLNMQGAHDLSAVRATAERLGLLPDHWNQFVDEARELSVGDGAPPFV